VIEPDHHAGPGTGGGVEAEVVGFGDDRLLLMPATPTLGLSPGARVRPLERPVRAPTLDRPSHPWRRAADRMRRLPMGSGLLGRVVDARGIPLDGLGPLLQTEPAPIHARPINAMQREPIREPLDTGVRAINAMLTVGRGQRLGLFAGAGVGKSVLLGMMARYTRADVIVVGLVGERGREVKEFLEDILGDEGRRRSVVVAAPADEPPLLRMQAANYATAIAERFRDEGRHVLLLMDSLTRYAMAAREVALAIGEPPATKGYPPSVFARLPQLVERSGNGPRGGGSITAFYTVLTEGDDPNDPIGDSARSFLDGHFVLSRRLAEAGHFPAIDVEQSISRVATAVTTEAHQRRTRAVRGAWATYQQNRDLIAVGAYIPGSDPEIDRAIAAAPSIADILRQDRDARCDFGQSLGALDALGIGERNRPHDEATQ
jgi:flagellum-specific ATP synthase